MRAVVLAEFFNKAFHRIGHNIRFENFIRFGESADLLYPGCVPLTNSNVFVTIKLSQSREFLEEPFFKALKDIYSWIM